MYQCSGSVGYVCFGASRILTGSVGQRYISEDPVPHPDPYQNVKDPQHWVPDLKIIKLPGNTTGSHRKGCDPRQPESLGQKKALYIHTSIYFNKKINTVYFKST
jgi:hypothetical protein